MNPGQCGWSVGVWSTSGARRGGGWLLAALLWLGLGGPARSQELPADGADARAPVTVGFVLDGPSERTGLMRLDVEKEIRTLVAGDFEVRFPEDRRYVGNWTRAGLRLAADAALADPEIDVLVALGVGASAEVARRGALPMPVVATTLLDAERLGVLREGGLSAVDNLCIVAVPTRGLEVAETLADLAETARITVVCHELYRDALGHLESELPPAALERGLRLDFVWVQGGPDEIVQALPADAEAVVLQPLAHLSRAQSEQLARAMIDRQLPSFSLLGRSDVELGHLATLVPDSDDVRLVRRTALNVHRIGLGEPPEDIAVDFGRTSRLTINIATARAIRLWPRFDLLIDAELINPEPEPVGDALTIVDAVQEAVALNLRLVAVEHFVAAGLHDVEARRAALLPQVDALLNATVIEKDRAVASGGSTARRTGEAALRLEQLIYDENVFAGIDISELAQQVRQWLRAELLLDVTQAAAVGYLDVLRLRTLQRIRSDDVELTRSNLELAQTRRRIGVADRSEVYRWEAQLATSKRSLVRTISQLHVSEILLKRLLNRPLGEHVRFVETGLDDPVLFPRGRRLEGVIDDPWSVEVLESFLVARGMQNSPELRQVEAELAVTERVLEARRAAYWAPVAGLFVQASRDFYRGGYYPPPAVFPGLDRDEWTAGLSLSLPLYQGGARSAQVSQATEDRARLVVERSAVAERIEESVRTSVQLVVASHTSIRLSRQAAEAARNNLDLVRDSYAQGVVSILDLLDAQNAALTAELESAAAIYDFLIDLMNVQRAAGEFHLFLTPGGMARWEDDVMAAMVRAGVVREGH